MKCVWHFFLPLITFSLGSCNIILSSEEITGPGSCPSIPSNIHETMAEGCLYDWLECSNDTDCVDTHKCCWNGFSHSCMDPNADYYCKSDDECFEAGMCNPCTLQCMCAMCSALYSPVCASDGKTYPNECAMDTEECETRTPIEVIYEGECGKVPINTTKVIIIVAVVVVLVILLTGIILAIVNKMYKQQRTKNRKGNRIENKQPLPVSVTVLPQSEPEKVALTP